MKSATIEKRKAQPHWITRPVLYLADKSKAIAAPKTRYDKYFKILTDGYNREEACNRELDLVLLDNAIRFDLILNGLMHSKLLEPHK
jgi:hypothetical protein